MMASEPATEPDEILPPEREGGEKGEELSDQEAAISKAIAKWLDECFRIPGTKIRFGLDPIIGLIPGGGETVATIIGAYIVGDASRRGIPFRTLFRMAGNMLLNGIVGVIPGLGDVFSVWFKSNARNYRLMRQVLDSPEGDKAEGGWWPLIVAALLLGGVFLIIITVFILVWRTIFTLFMPVS